MNNQTITCPNCGQEIEISEAISHQIEDSLKRQFEEDKKRIEKEAEKKAKASFDQDKRRFEEELSEKQKKLEESQKAELELRKKQREVEEKEKNLELEIARKVDAEKDLVRQSVLQSVQDEYRLKEKEKDKVISDMRTQIDDLKRKAEQGSQQTQGEVLELEFEDLLRATFPYDTIEPVAKGVKGADVVQKINSQTGQFCGTILWENKRAKNWSDGWLSKIKDDTRDIKADISVIMTMSLPKEVKSFGLLDGVWVTNYTSAIGLATVLRLSLIQLANARQSEKGKGEKMEILYNYLSSNDFRLRMEGIVDAFKSMKDDLESEKRALKKQWSKREMQIEQVISNTVGMYGDMQAIMGASLQEIESLEIKSLTEGNSEEE